MAVFRLVYRLGLTPGPPLKQDLYSILKPAQLLLYEANLLKLFRKSPAVMPSVAEASRVPK